MLREAYNRDMSSMNRAQRLALLGSAAVVVGYTLWTASRGEAAEYHGGALVLSTLMRALAAFFVSRLIIQTEAPREKRSWRLLAVALGLLTLSDVGVCVTYLSRGALPTTPSASDLVRLAGLLAAIAMVVYHPVSTQERFALIREFLDVSILFLAGTSLAFLIFIWPVFELGLGEAVLIFWLSIAPLFDFALLGFLLRIVLRASSRRERWTFRILILAFFAYFIGDLGASYELIRLEPFNQGYRHAATMAGSVLVMLAALRWSLPDRDGLRLHRMENLRAGFAPRVEPLLPIAATYVVVGYILIGWWYSGDLNWGAVVLTGVLSMMLVARQGVVVGQFELRQHLALVQASADGAFVCQLDGRLRLANPALFNLLDIEEQRANQLTLADILGDEVAAKDILASAKRTGWVGETELGLPARTAVSVSLSLMPITDRGGRTQLLAGSVHDLTLIQEREDALRDALADLADAHARLAQLNRDLEGKVSERTQELQDSVEKLRRLNVELQSLDHMKSEFVALVSHELRAPLTNIRSGVELILETNSGFDDQVVNTLELVERETTRLTDFVEAILDISALEAGRFPLELQAVPLPPVLERVLERIPALGRKDALVVSLPANLPDVMADERALASVLFHLLDNAVKYAPGSPIEVVAWCEEGEIYTAVMDYGPGIPVELRAKAFDIFERLDPSDTRETYGHGLGLHMARRFVEAMGGAIGVEDAEGYGARLVFHLPGAIRSEPDTVVDEAVDAEGV